MFPDDQRSKVLISTGLCTPRLSNQKSLSLITYYLGELTTTANSCLPEMHKIAFLIHLFTLFLYASECHAKVSSTVHACGIDSSTSSTATFRNTLLSIPKAEKIREWSQYYTKESHFVGQGYEQAEWTKARWDEFGIPMTNLTTHKANLTFPSQHRVALLDLKREGSVVHEAALIEEGIPPVSDGGKPFLPAFLAWSPEGNTTGQYVFANFGLAEDYQDLEAANVSLRGKIAVVKTVFGSQLLKDLGVATHRASQLAAAAKHGISGMIMYTDPQNDGNITEKNGYQPFPDGPARPPSLIERGSIHHGMSTHALASSSQHTSEWILTRTRYI